MGRASLFLTLAAFAALGGCVQTRQYANVEFTAPQGDYDLIVMRPVVEVGTVTAGGLVQPNAEWSQQARTQLLDSLRRYQTERGGRTVFLENRAGVEGVPPETVASHDTGPVRVAPSAMLDETVKGVVCAASTTVDGALVAEADPAVFDALTSARTLRPTSADAS